MQAAQRKRRGWILAVSIVGAILTAVAFGVNYRPADVHVEQSLFTSYMTRLAESLDGYGFTWGALAAALAACYYWALSRCEKRVFPSLIALGLLFGLLNVAGAALRARDSFDFVCKNRYQLMLALCCAVGWGFPFYAVGALLLNAVDRPAPAAPREAKGALLRLWESRPALCSAAVLLVCWSPWLVAFWPGSVPHDTAYQLEQYLGVLRLNDWHPIFSTLLVGGCISVGRALGSDNLGVFVYILLQLGVWLAVFSNIVKSALRWSGRRWVALALLAFYALTPYWGAYAQSSIKDSLFTGLFMGFVLLTAAIVRGERGRLLPLGYLAVGLLVCLMRHNGVYAVAPTMLCVAILALRTKRGLWYPAVAVLTVLLFVGCNQLFLRIDGVWDRDNQREMLSIPIQQTSRYLRDHADEVTPEEREAIELALPFDELAAGYDPITSDPVRVLWKNPDSAGARAYFSAWLGMFLKHPLTYIEATIANTSGYYAFVPLNDAKIQLQCENYQRRIDEAGLTIAWADGLADARAFLLGLSKAVTNMPLVGLVYARAAYFWALALCALCFIRTRRARLLIVVLPCLMIWLTCLAAAVNDYMRLALPMMGAAPIALSLIPRADARDGAAK